MAQPEMALLLEECCGSRLGGMYVVASLLAYTRAGLWVNLLFPLFAVAGNQGAITSFKYLTEKRQKHLIRRAFQYYYLHSAIVDQIL